MSKIWKTTIVIITIISINAGIWFMTTHKTYYRYNDSWIIGRHYSEVEKRYGKFNEEWGGARGYYIDDSLLDMYLGSRGLYWVECDKDGIVMDVFITKSS